MLKYRVIIAILIVVIIIGVIIIFNNRGNYRSQINASNDSISVLDGIIQVQEDIITESQRIDVEDSLRVVNIQDSTKAVIQRLKQRNYEYRKEINSRDSIPMDDRYVEFKEWIRTIQF